MSNNIRIEPGAFYAADAVYVINNSEFAVYLIMPQLPAKEQAIPQGGATPAPTITPSASGCVCGAMRKESCP